MLLISLTLTVPVLAQDPIDPEHSGPAWEAQYWNNPSLNGRPSLERLETDLDHDWGTDSPHPSVPHNEFSARWSRYVSLPAGVYRFTATSDDGIRVWVDGDLIIDEWSEHPVRSFKAEKRLEAGRHWIKVEYYEAEETAQIELTWESLTSRQDWRGEYYDNPDLAGPPLLVRLDPQIAFDWLWSSPAPNFIPPDGFSVRWSQTVDLEPGYYQFAVTVDDGGRLWVDDHLLIDGWQDQVARTYTGDVYLTGGDTSIQMEYYENEGVASARLSWTRLGQLPAPGTVVVDDTYSGFRAIGPPGDWHLENEGYADQLTWSLNSDLAKLQ